MARAKLDPLAPQIGVETRQALEQPVDFLTVDSLESIDPPARNAISPLISSRLRLLAVMTFAILPPVHLLTPSAPSCRNGRR
jgi:hypothetical protein